MVIDRVEGDLAIVELGVGRFVNIPVSCIEGRVRDGAVLVKLDDNQYRIDEEQTALVSARAAERTRNLFGKRS